MDNLCPACLQTNLGSATVCIYCGSIFASKPVGQVGQIPQVSPFHLPAGTLLKQTRYQVVNTLGEGGFGITYKGIDLLTFKEIAIKELWWAEKFFRQGKAVVWSSSVTPKARREQIEKFKYEANSLQNCQHPNIVKVGDWFEENNTGYIIMDLIKGKSLYKIFEEEKKPLSETRLKKYFIQVASALKVVHFNNLLHRDIKPDNIMIDKQDNAILIDFGNAREFVDDKTGRMTTILSQGYAPLEQYATHGRRGPGTDFYALCASMYEMLTGKLPEEATARINSETLIPPRQIVPEISSITEKVLLTGLRLRIEERFQTADELIDALNGKFVSPSLRRSRQLVEQHKLAEAVQAYEKCLANEPNNGEAAVELALVQTYVNDSQAEVAAKIAIQVQPKDGRGYGVLGLVNCRKAKWAAAVKYLQQAANLAPNESWIQANLAWALGKSGSWQQAETAVARAIQLDSNSTFALGLQAWIAVNQQQWKPAIRTARLAIAKSKQTNPNKCQELQRWVYPCLTFALDRAVVTKQAPDVERCIQEFTTQVPDSTFVWGFKGWKQASLGLWADAIHSFEQAKRQAQAPAWVFLNLGSAHEHLKNIQSAIQVYEAYSRMFQNDAFALFRLGTLLGRQGQWSQARSCLERAVQFKPDYAEAHHNLGWVLLNIRSGDGHAENFREIWSAYRKAAELYAQQQKYALAQDIKQAFQVVEVEL